MKITLPKNTKKNTKPHQNPRAAQDPSVLPLTKKGRRPRVYEGPCARARARARAKYKDKISFKTHEKQAKTLHNALKRIATPSEKLLRLKIV